LSGVDGYILVIIGLAIAQGIAFELLVPFVLGGVRHKPWWPQAFELQKALMMNFGYVESEIHEKMALESYCYVLTFGCHHCIAAALTMPVAFCGWEAAGLTGQYLFLGASLATVGLDVFDAGRLTLLSWFPHTFKCWHERVPLGYWFIGAVLHHTTSIIMMLPMCLNYMTLRSFHVITCTLLTAGGIAFTTGPYKFTIDTSSKDGLSKYKVVVVVQLLTVWITRAFVWFPQAYSLLTTIRETAGMPLFVGTCVAGTLMSLFNVLNMLDSLDAAAKWLPKSIPDTGVPQPLLAA